MIDPNLYLMIKVQVQFNILAHPARTKVMLKKTLHKNGIQGGYNELMVVSEQALPKLRLLLPIVKKFQITFGSKLSLISS